MVKFLGSRGLPSFLQKTKLLVVSFIGRKTDQTPHNNYEQGKYKKLLTHSENHPYVSETVQNSYFYGEDTIRGKGHFIITEGITDAIMDQQGGIPCISPVTVRFRKEDYPKLLKLAKQVSTVYIANDNEESKAGEEGAWDTAEYLLSKGIRVRLISLPRAEDVDKVDLAEYLKNHSKDDFEELRRKAKSPIEIKIEKVEQAAKAEKFNIVETVYSLFIGLDQMQKEMYTKELHKALDKKVRITVLRKKIEDTIEEKRKTNAIYQQQFEIARDRLKVTSNGPISSLYENDNGYYNPKENQDGEVIPDYISNFRLNVDEILIHPQEGELISGTLIFSDDEKADFEINSEALVSNINFKKHLPSKAVWLGTEKNLQTLKVNIYANGPSRRTGVSNAGRHGNKILMPALTIDKNGPVDDPDIALIDLYKNKFLAKLPKCWPDEEEHQKAAKGIYKHLHLINDITIAGAVIAWNFALPWCDLIRTKIRWGGYPHLVIFGEAGCGKTQTVKVIWRLNGISQDKEPYTLPNTRFT